MMKDYAQHELGRLFPKATDEEFFALKDDIEKNGQQDTVVLLDGKILDGWHRHTACYALGIETKVVEFPKDQDPLAYVISRNLHRRHLSPSQRAIIAAKLEKNTHGGDRKSENQDANLHVDRTDAAKMMNVSERSVDTASKVLKECDPETVQEVESGATSLNAAVKRVKEKKEYPSDFAKQVSEGVFNQMTAKEFETKKERAKKLMLEAFSLIDTVMSNGTHALE